MIFPMYENHVVAIQERFMDSTVLPELSSLAVKYTLLAIKMEPKTTMYKNGGCPAATMRLFLSIKKKAPEANANALAAVAKAITMIDTTDDR